MNHESRLAAMPCPVSILGAGMMGCAIAAAHLRRGVPVALFDSMPESLRSAPQRVAEELRLQDCRFDPELLVCTEDLDVVLRSPILIETITEKLRAKQKLYRKLRQRALEIDEPPEMERFLFSNTSTISITELAANLSDSWRRRFCGFHFFHPVRQRSLLEIIAGRETDSETIRRAREHALRIEKQPIQVRDGPGFLVNRILNPYLTSTLQLFGEGVEMRRIERVATDFGMKMGPFRIMDEIGLDVVLHAGWVLFKAFPDRVPYSPILLELVERGRLGRKTGRGFMLYPNSTSWDGDGTPDPELASSESVREISDEEIVRRLFLSMYEEAIRCLEDGIIEDPSDADLASVHALGFPEEKGGIVSWTNRDR